jgi:hypothetical protein
MHLAQIEKTRVWACIFKVEGADDIMCFFNRQCVLCCSRRHVIYDPRIQPLWWLEK